MNFLEIIKGKSGAASLSVTRAGEYNVAFGYVDSDGFNVVKPSRDYKTETGARRAAKRWVNRK